MLPNCTSHGAPAYGPTRRPQTRSGFALLVWAPGARCFRFESEEPTPSLKQYKEEEKIPLFWCSSRAQTRTKERKRRKEKACACRSKWVYLFMFPPRGGAAAAPRRACAGCGNVRVGTRPAQLDRAPVSSCVTFTSTSTSTSTR